MSVQGDTLVKMADTCDKPVSKYIRYRARKRFKEKNEDGTPMPQSIQKRKGGRPITNIKNQKRRMKYREDKIQEEIAKETLLHNQIAHSKSTVNPYYEGSDFVRDMAKKLNSLKSFKVDVVNRRFEKVMNHVSKRFRWLKTEQKAWVLYYVQEGGYGEVLHPWLEIKQSGIMDENEKLNMGVFALRDFEATEEIGIYFGQYEATKEENTSMFGLNYKRGRIDIPDKGKKRLHYGLGMHLINDLDWPCRQLKSKNNAHIQPNLLVVAKSFINKGSEITCSYFWN